jgi:hypothetical protein
MAKIDEVKESLNSLRAYFAVVVLLIVSIGSGVISSYRAQIFDAIFWLGFLIELCLILIGIFILHKVKVKTNEIGDL